MTDLHSGILSTLAVDATGQHVVAVGDQHDWLSSSDGGATFQPASAPPAFDPNLASVVALDGTSQTFLAGGNRDLVESDDGGQTWLADDIGLASTPAYSLAEGPTRAALFAGTRDDGVGVPANSGLDWSFSGPPPWDVQSIAADANGTTVYAGTPSGLWISTDSGGSWTLSSALDTGDVSALAADPKNPGVAFAATYGSTLAAGGLWRSVDFGASWQRIDAGLMSHAFTALAVDAPMDQVVAAIDDEGAAISDEQTINWSLAGPLRHIDALAIDALGAIYAGTCTASSGGVYLSADERSFTQHDVDLPTVCVTGLAADPKVEYPGLCDDVWRRGLRIQRHRPGLVAPERGPHRRRPLRHRAQWRRYDRACRRRARCV